MSVAVAVLVAASVFLMARAVQIPSVSDRVALYLGVSDEDEEHTTSGRSTRLARGMPWIAVGSFVGVLVAQGDLFIGGPGRSIPGLGLIGGAAGWFAYSAHQTNLRERRDQRLREELPVVVDALALQIVSGESVVSALQNVSGEIGGVAGEEIEDLVASLSMGGVDVALTTAARQASVDEARRLCELLAHAHTVGGRLADSLVELAADFRAGLERDLTAESGRRAVAAYGPVLALMVPTALMFLLYPTLLGLRALSGAP